MLNWQELKNDLPKQITVLCDYGSEFSSLLDLSEKDKEFFHLAKPFRELISSFERLRQFLKTVVFTKATELEKIKVPLVEYPLEEGEEKKMISLPVKKYIQKFEEDLKLYYSGVDEILKSDTITISGQTKFFFNLRSFESYVYDIIVFSKKEFYKKVKAYDYKKRQEIKDRVIKVIEWKLEQLNEIAERVLKEGVSYKDYVRLVIGVILTLKSISSPAEILSITTKKIKYDYPSIWLLISKIKNKQLKINDLANTCFIIPKIKIANNPPFNYYFNRLLKEEITHAFNFPKPEQEEVFWSIFLASIIQRAGLIPEIKEKAKEIGGRTEVVVG